MLQICALRLMPFTVKAWNNTATFICPEVLQILQQKQNCVTYSSRNEARSSLPLTFIGNFNLYINLSSLKPLSYGGQTRDAEAERETVDILIKVPRALLCCFLWRIAHRPSDVETGKAPVPNWSCQTSIPPRLHTGYSPDQGQASSIMQQPKNKDEEHLGGDVPLPNGMIAADFKRRKRSATSARWRREISSGSDSLTEKA